MEGELEVLQTGGLTDICTYGSSDVQVTVCFIWFLCRLQLSLKSRVSRLCSIQKKKGKEEESSVVLGYKRATAASLRSWVQ